MLITSIGVKDDKWEMKGKLELDSGRYYLFPR